MRLLAIILIVTIIIARAHTQNLDLFAGYHSIGVKVTGIANADSCWVDYKKIAEEKWLRGFDTDKIVIGNQEQFRGSLFLLEENSEYAIRVTLLYGTTNVTLPVIHQKTRKSPSFFPTNQVKWVSPNGTGDFSEANPGNLTALFSSGQVICGTTIILTEGIYKQYGLQLQINTDCTENTPIMLLAAPGAKPVIDAGVEISTSWTRDINDQNLFSTAIPVSASHSNICILGKTALYPYPSVEANPYLGGFNLNDLNFGYDGFVRDENTIWIKTLDGINPNDSTVMVSAAFRFLTVYGNDRNAYLKIKGIEFRNFGKPMLNAWTDPVNSYGATVFDLRNVHHIYFDDCRFIFNTSHISLNNTCNFFTIQNCYFEHNAGKWSHAMIKKSHDYIHTLLGSVSSSRGRGVENAAIFIHESKCGVIRNNYFHGLNSGIESYFDTGIKEEMDIYNNVFIDNFDAIECDGLWSNLRVWNNEIIRPMAGISAAPPVIGPRYFYRNLIHGMKGRRNEKNDPHFIACQPIDQDYRSQAIGIKTNSDYQGNLPPGNLYFFNNTFHADDPLGFVITSWKAEWRTAVFINNSYSHSIGHPFFYFSLADQDVNKDFQITSLNDNYFSFDPASPVAVIKHIHGQYHCTDIPNVSDLQFSLSNISGSPHILIQQPTQNDPEFTDASIGGFGLNDHSPLINAGRIIPGFYDFQGVAPDIGAKEAKTGSYAEGLNYEEFEISVFPNPGTGIFRIITQDDISKTKIEVFNSIGQKVCFKDKLVEGENIDLTGFPDGLYFVVTKQIYKTGIAKYLKTRSNTR